MKMILPRAPELEPHHQMEFSAMYFKLMLTGLEDKGDLIERRFLTINRYMDILKHRF